jgi:hypothetical protein
LAFSSFDLLLWIDDEHAAGALAVSRRRFNLYRVATRGLGGWLRIIVLFRGEICGDGRL